MTNDCDSLAKEFLSRLSVKDKTRLYNDLLALEEVHRLNQDISYYTFKNLKRVAHRRSERRKRSFSYTTEQNDELVIHQIHEQHFFKNTYKIKIYFNLQEYEYHLIDCILSALKKPNTSRVMVLQEISI